MKVRVTVLVAAVLLLAARPGFSQDMLTYGLKVGINFADIASPDDDDEEEFKKKKVGVAVGGFVDVPVAPMFSIQPEFLFTQKGAKFEAEDPQFGNFKATISVDMIQVPVLGKVKFAGASVRPFVVFGPGFGFVTRGRQEVEEDGDVEEEDIKDDIESVDVSLIVGGGVQFGNASVELRWDHGLRNLVKDDEDDEAKTRTLTILFGYGWP
jgi:hypothetical protein